MSGRWRCFCVFVLAGFLGSNWACGADEGAQKKSPPPSQTQAKQFKGLKILKRPPGLKKGETISPEAAIRRALETRVRAEFGEAPLKEVCQTIEKQLGISVHIDRRALDDEGLDADTPMSCAMNDVRLRSCLDLMLSEEDLTWTIHREVLLITSTAMAQEMLVTRVYDLADLAASSEPGYSEFSSLIELITCVLLPESWSDTGSGPISTIDMHGIQALVIPQTVSAHDDIEKLLVALRAHIPKEKSKTTAIANSLKPDGQKAASDEETIRRVLQKKVDLNFKETPLCEVVAHLKKLLQLEIQLHKRSLGGEGLDLETPITFQVTGISAAAAMDLMLRDLSLTYFIKDNYLLILTEDEEEEFIKVYGVADLVDDSEGLDGLVEVITSTISPESWSEIGGEGSIGCFENAGMKVLVVSQTQRVQAEIKKFFADLRKVQRQVDDKQPVPDGMGPRLGGPGMGMPGMGPGMGGGSGMGGGFRPQGRQAGMAGMPMDMLDGLFTRQRKRTPIRVKKDPTRDALVKGSNQFAFDLYAKLREENPGKNMFFSPMSISTTMAMTYAGARGKTAEDIAQTMHFTLPQRRLHSACRSLLEISQGSDSHELYIANRLWAHRDYKFLDSFLNLTKMQYGAECGLVDFVADRESATQQINFWVTQQTQGRIRDLIKPDLIDSFTRLVLTNAIYFKGQWRMPFETRHTKPALFFAEDGIKPVSMMSMIDFRARYAKIDEPGLQILEKSYGQTSNTSMMILLPKREPGSLAKLEASLTEEKLTNWSKQLEEKEVQIYLPKFRMETDYLLNKQLAEMGMRRAFEWNPSDPNAVDFSGMDGTRNLFLQFVIHKTFVDVDEQGTEAAAATGMVGGLGGMPPKPIEFRADHPFVFLIRDNRTGSILFLGRFCGPEPDAASEEMQRGGGMF